MNVEHVVPLDYLTQMTTTRMEQPTTQWDGPKFAIKVDWSNMGIRTVKLPANLFNQDSPPIVPVLDEEVLQYFVDNQNVDTMPSHCYLLGRHTLGLRQFLSE